MSDLFKTEMELWQVQRHEKGKMQFLLRKTLKHSVRLIFKKTLKYWLSYHFERHVPKCVQSILFIRGFFIHGFAYSRFFPSKMQHLVADFLEKTANMDQIYKRFRDISTLIRGFFRKSVDKYLFAVFLEIREKKGTWRKNRE